jgi:hypothetical protein
VDGIDPDLPAVIQRHRVGQVRQRALLDGLPQSRLSAAHEHHGVPVGGEPVRNRGPEAGTGTRDDDHAAGILLVHEFPVCRMGRAGTARVCPTAEA